MRRSSPATTCSRGTCAASRRRPSAQRAAAAVCLPSSSEERALLILHRPLSPPLPQPSGRSLLLLPLPALSWPRLLRLPLRALPRDRPRAAPTAAAASLSRASSSAARRSGDSRPTPPWRPSTTKAMTATTTVNWGRRKAPLPSPSRRFRTSPRVHGEFASSSLSCGESNKRKIRFLIKKERGEKLRVRESNLKKKKKNSPSTA